MWRPISCLCDACNHTPLHAILHPAALGFGRAPCKAREQGIQKGNNPNLVAFFLVAMLSLNNPPLYPSAPKFLWYGNRKY
eukprot:682670-Amphidinium_carterae.2